MINFDILKKFKSKPKNRVGLDIGSSAVKMIEISASDGAANLLGLGLKVTSSAVRQPLIEAIKALAEEIKVSVKEVNISVSGPSVIVRFVSMPKMRDDELKGAIRFEAEKHIPFAINDCIVDHQVLRRNESENKLDVLLVAVKKSLVMDRIAIAEECGFTVAVIDVDTFAAANAYMRNFPIDHHDKSTAILNIGSLFTNVGIVENQVLCFARDIAIGANDIGQGAKHIIANLLDEVRLSFSYYENQSGKEIGEVCISGGGASLAGLEAALQEAFESKPRLWDPLQFLDVSKTVSDAKILNTMKSSFAVAAGLALR